MHEILILSARVLGLRGRILREAPAYLFTQREDNPQDPNLIPTSPHLNGYPHSSDSSSTSPIDSNQVNGLNNPDSSDSDFNDSPGSNHPSGPNGPFGPGRFSGSGPHNPGGPDNGSGGDNNNYSIILLFLS